MKTTIRADGTLSVSPESDLEAYALNQWSRDNIGDWFDVTRPRMKLIVDLSGYAAQMGLFVAVGAHQS